MLKCEGVLVKHALSQFSYYNKEPHESSVINKESQQTKYLFSELLKFNELVDYSTLETMYKADKRTLPSNTQKKKKPNFIIFN